MKRIFEFLVWTWGRFDSSDKTIIVLVLVFGLPTLMMIPFFGKLSLIWLLSGLIGIVAFWVIFAIHGWLRKTWKEFNRKCPPEDIRIINKLKGKSVNWYD